MQFIATTQNDFYSAPRKRKPAHMAKPSGKCASCGADLSFKYTPMRQWNIHGYVCGQCYSQKLTDHYISPDRRDITKK